MEFNQLSNHITTIISTTNLETPLLITTTFYLDQLTKNNLIQRLSPNELSKTLIALLMIANKCHNDSSYTFKTWINLSSELIDTETLKAYELSLLKKLNYNLFWKTTEEYDDFVDYLYNQCVNHNLFIDSITETLPPLNHQLKRSFEDEEFFFTMRQKPILSSPAYNEFNQTYILTPVSTQQDQLYQFQELQKIQNILPPLPVQYYYPSPFQLQPLEVPINAIDPQDQPFEEHPENCQCCYWTNMTNSYHSSLRQLKL